MPEVVKLTDEQRQLTETAARIARDRYRPKALAWDEARQGLSGFD